MKCEDHKSSCKMGSDRTRITGPRGPRTCRYFTTKQKSDPNMALVSSLKFQAAKDSSPCRKITIDWAAIGMASTSKKWTRIVSRFASQIYFLLIIFQIPVFRFPCRIGTCETPMEVTSSQLIASEVLPAVVVKTILYPGAIAKAIVKNTAIPSYDNLLTAGKFINMGKGPSIIDLKHMEVLAGSYLSVAGAFLGLIRPGRTSLFGILLIICGIAREVNFGNHATKDRSKEICVCSTMYIAVLSAFFSVRGDVRKLIRSSKIKYIIHPLRYSKAKYKKVI